MPQTQTINNHLIYNETREWQAARTVRFMLQAICLLLFRHSQKWDADAVTTLLINTHTHTHTQKETSIQLCKPNWLMSHKVSLLRPQVTCPINPVCSSHVNLKFRVSPWWPSWCRKMPCRWSAQTPPRSWAPCSTHHKQLNQELVTTTNNRWHELLATMRALI
jgi:hypothetical protein